MKFDGVTCFGCLIVIIIFLAAVCFSGLFLGTTGIVAVVILSIVGLINMFLDGKSNTSKPAQSKNSDGKSDTSRPVQSKKIDVDKLRQYMLDDDYAAYLVGDLGGALAEAADIENVSDEDLVEMAKRQGIDLRRFEV